MPTLTTSDAPPIAIGLFRLAEEDKINAWITRYAGEYVLDKPALVFLKERDELGGPERDVAWLYLHGAHAEHLVRQVRVQQGLQKRVEQGAGRVVGLESALPRIGGPR